jgi:hypothetical protein
MKSTAQQQDDLYEIIYAAAPWIELGNSVGFFATIQMGKDDLVNSVFTKGTDGTDTLIIFINPQGDNSPVLQYIHQFPIEAGSYKSGISTQLLVKLINEHTGEELAMPRTLPYGRDAYDPTPRPHALYMLSYLSGPYARFNGRRTAEDEVFIIINMSVLENDRVDGVFTTGTSGEDYDTFELKVTSEETGTPKMFCHVFGPYTLTNPDTVTVMVSSSVNGKPAQKPVGIKSYGNDSWFF